MRGPGVTASAAIAAAERWTAGRETAYELTRTRSGSGDSPQSRSNIFDVDD